jgi:hypothetical protein
MWLPRSAISLVLMRDVALATAHRRALRVMAHAAGRSGTSTRLASRSPGPNWSPVLPKSHASFSVLIGAKRCRRAHRGRRQSVGDRTHPFHLRPYGAQARPPGPQKLVHKYITCKIRGRQVTSRGDRRGPGSVGGWPADRYGGEPWPRGWRQWRVAGSYRMGQARAWPMPASERGARCNSATRAPAAPTRQRRTCR